MMMIENISLKLRTSKRRKIKAEKLINFSFAVPWQITRLTGEVFFDKRRPKIRRGKVCTGK